ncbi:MAG: SPASM domain-containing protein [Alphaproteobacteria bacterium]|nr:SPASM domain-containing protein [Alphaproteobacteria bacterium]
MRPPCAGLWLTPMVHVDGDVTTCCLDEHVENRIGNLRQTPLAALWSGARITAWRRAHVEGRFADSGPLCTRCNWRSAGAAPDGVVEAWLEKLGDAGLSARWAARKRRRDDS